MAGLRKGHIQLKLPTREYANPQARIAAANLSEFKKLPPPAPFSGGGGFCPDGRRDDFPHYRGKVRIQFFCRS